MQVIHVLESDIGIFVENLKFNGYYKGRRGQGGREGTKPISKFCLGVDKNVIPGMFPTSFSLTRSRPACFDQTCPSICNCGGGVEKCMQ